MEILAQCSRVLYDKRILDITQKLQVLENKVPRVKFETKAEWGRAVNQFTQEIKTFVLQEIVITTLRESVEDSLKKICNYYCERLSILMKGKHLEWCERKSAELLRILHVGITGLRRVYESGSGSYPFTHWRPQEWLHFIYGLIYDFETSYEQHKYGYEHGWVGQIPYYHCCACNTRIDTVYMYHGEYIYLFEQRCVKCIKKVLNKVKRIQAQWRGYRVRSDLDIV